MILVNHLIIDITGRRHVLSTLSVDVGSVGEQHHLYCRILGKRKTVWGTQYKVRWRSTWLPEGKLGNAQELLQEFKANGRARHGRKRVRLAEPGAIQAA